MAEFILEYGKTTKPAEADGRLEGPAFRRNHEPIWQAISQFLHGATGDVLEVGSGTGQHVTGFARLAPHLTWWPSDIFDAHLASIAAWGRQARLENLRPPQRIDLSDPGWTWNEGRALSAILCINVLHIAPWRVAQNLIAGAGRLLRDGGKLFVYGPFKRDGRHIAPSNAAFDESLRAENPNWGVRDVHDLDVLARAAGLSPADISPMPANNLVLSFTRTSRHN